MSNSTLFCIQMHICFQVIFEFTITKHIYGWDWNYKHVMNRDEESKYLTSENVFKKET